MTRSTTGTPARSGVSFFRDWRTVRLVEWAVLVALALGSLLLLRIYSLAFGFGFSFDDNWNLSGLGAIADLRSALEFIAGGAAGPLGRPLALLSFVPHAASWPSAPQDFLYENALLHVLNMWLLFWLAYRMATHLPWGVKSPAWMALFAALWWGASPLLFSTSAMIVQRMTSLSVLFCLLGCLSYVIGWQRLRERPRTGFMLMAWGAGGCTLLAVLCKENGALLPGLILIIDRVLLARSTNTPHRFSVSTGRWYRNFRVFFLWLPVVAVVAYLASRLPGITTGYQTRSFTPGERLLTESRIVLDYLRLLIFPVGSDLGPFHDDYPLSTGLLHPISTLAAVATLVAATIAAWRLRKGGWRLFTFTWIWFLWAHIVESTVIPLELYFEHRNYLAALGIAIALAGLLFHPQVQLRARVAVAALALVCSLFVLHANALLWGDRLLASASWYQSHPQSLRALQFHLVVLHEQQRFDEYIDVVSRVEAPLRDGAEYAMIRLVSACNFGNHTDVARAAEAAIVKLRTTAYNPAVTDMLNTLVEKPQAHGCLELARSALDEMLTAVATNPDPRIRDDMRAQAHEIHARLTIGDRNLDASMHHLEEAFRLRPTLSDGIAMVGLLVSAGLYDDAERKLDELVPHEPHRPFVRERWRTTVAEMREIVGKARIDAT